MKLEDLGYNEQFEEYKIEQKLEGFEPGRIIEEHKERYTVKTLNGEYESEITGNMRFTAKTREDFPAVGDWVALTTYDSYNAIIHKILPRYSVIKRKAVGQNGQSQIIATNIDYAFIVQAVDRDFNINRIERYLTLCNSSKVEPIIVLSKTDLIGELQLNEIIESIKVRIKNVPVIPISNETQQGYDVIKSIIKKRKTYCMLGSSGVGKSTLLNRLAGKIIMATDTLGKTTNKGKHVTSHRELIILDSGGILIDNPGMREVGIADTTDGLEITFDEIARFSQNCKFHNCTHTSEIGCSVLEAIEKGELERSSYENYLKMQKEKAFFDSTLAERRKREKLFGRIIKKYKKDANKNNY